MTTKTKMSNLESYQELSIQITTLEMKIDKVLELLNKPEYEIVNVMSINDHTHTGLYDEQFTVDFK